MRDQTFTEPGARYIDFLIPGLIGLNLVGPSGRPEFGVPVLLLAVAVLVLLGTPAARAALARDHRDPA